MKLLTSVFCTIIIGSVNAQNVNIPDANFKNVLTSNMNINTNGDSEIQVSEAIAFNGAIFVSNQGISSLTGIEEFVNIVGLDCRSNDLTFLNIGGNTALEAVRCSNNTGLNSLDVSQNTALQSLEFENTLISSIDLSANTALTALNCRQTPLLSSLDVSANVALGAVDCGESGLSILDFSSLPSLQLLRCDQNALTSLNLTNGNNANLMVMEAWGNSNLTCIQHDVGFDPVTVPTWMKDSTASWSESCNVSGVEKNEMIRIELIPNPTEGVFTIISENTIESIEIVSLAGKTIGRFESNIIDLSDQEAGVYFVMIKTTGHYSTNRIIKT